MTDTFTGSLVSSMADLFDGARVRLLSSRGDYLYRNAEGTGFTTIPLGASNPDAGSNAGDGVTFTVECAGAKIRLKSWRSDYLCRSDWRLDCLHRPGELHGVTASVDRQPATEWALEKAGDNVKLKSSRQDYLHQPESAQGITSWGLDDGDLWTIINPLTPWPNRTALPDGSSIAIRLRCALTEATTEAVVPWVKWLGLSNDGIRLEAVDSTLGSRNIFKIQTFMPPGQQYYNLPWFCLQACNGNYVSIPGSRELIADQSDINAAGMFARGWNDHEADLFLTHLEPWGSCQSFLDNCLNLNTYTCRVMCAATDVHQESIQWTRRPDLSAYLSGHVDFFVL